MRDIDNEVIRYVALRDVERGEELCICYGDNAKLGFKDVSAEEEEHAPEDGEAMNGIGKGVFD